MAGTWTRTLSPLGASSEFSADFAGLGSGPFRATPRKFSQTCALGEASPLLAAPEERPRGGGPCREIACPEATWSAWERLEIA